MADAADLANEEYERRMRIWRKNRIESPPKKVEPTGKCLNCLEQVLPGEYYCDDDCKEDCKKNPPRRRG